MSTIAHHTFSLSEDDVANLWCRIVAQRKSKSYNDRTFIDVPTHQLEALLRLADCSRLKDGKP